jgi:hypothetical protein
VNNGNLPNYDEVQQWRSDIFFSHFDPPTLIEKKTIGKKEVVT